MIWIEVRYGDRLGEEGERMVDIILETIFELTLVWSKLFLIVLVVLFFVCRFCIRGGGG